MYHNMNTSHKEPSHKVTDDFKRITALYGHVPFYLPPKELCDNGAALWL